MRYRVLGRTGWPVSEIGFGTWGMGGWTGSDDRESAAALQRAVERGVNFFDTAWAYGDGHSEKLLGQLIARNSGTKIIVASKIPPKNRVPSARAEHTLDETYPPDHIREYAEKSLRNLGLGSIDVMQFHVWHDRWASDKRWQRATTRLKDEGVVRAWGISVNRWEPTNGLEAVKTGLIDTVQVVYNIFDQNPEDELFPVCRDLGVGVIARVPFDEGALTGGLTAQSTWSAGDWRRRYFEPGHLAETLARVATLRPIVPPGMAMPELALRFVLQNPVVSTVIPGMRRIAHVVANTAVSDGERLTDECMQALRQLRWVRYRSDDGAPLTQ